MNKNSGITLVALIVTIIVLLILAGISIATLSGENGLFARAKQARQNTLEAQEQENEVLGSYINEIDNHISIGSARDTLEIQTLYPNGTAENPATISTGDRIEIDNPYPGHRVYCIAEVFYNNMWGSSGFIFSAGSGGGWGVAASQLIGENIDKIIVQVGSSGTLGIASNQGGSFGNNVDITTPLPYRVIVICLD